MPSAVNFSQCNYEPLTIVFLIIDHFYRFVGINMLFFCCSCLSQNAHKQDLVAKNHFLHFSCSFSGDIVSEQVILARAFSVVDALSDAQKMCAVTKGDTVLKALNIKN